MDLTYYTALKYLIEKNVAFDEKTIDDSTIPQYSPEVQEIVEFLIAHHGYERTQPIPPIQFNDEWLTKMETDFITQNFSSSPKGEFAKFGRYLLTEHYRRHTFTKPDVLLTDEERTDYLKKYIASIAQEYYKKTGFTISRIDIVSPNEYYTNVNLTLTK